MTYNTTSRSKRILAIDRDGTLVGSCRANFEAYSSAISEYGVEVPAVLNQLIHLGYSWESICKSEFPDLSEDVLKRIHSRKSEIFPEFFHLLNWNHELVEQARTEKWVCVSNGTINSSKLILAGKPQLSPISIIGPSDKLKPKPSPDMYLYLIESLRISCSNVLVYEDSDIGRVAAENAGLEVKTIEHRC